MNRLLLCGAAFFVHRKLDNKKLDFLHLSMNKASPVKQQLEKQHRGRSPKKAIENM